MLAEQKPTECVVKKKQGQMLSLCAKAVCVREAIWLQVSCKLEKNFFFKNKQKNDKRKPAVPDKQNTGISKDV